MQTVGRLALALAATEKVLVLLDVPSNLLRHPQRAAPLLLGRPQLEAAAPAQIFSR